MESSLPQHPVPLKRRRKRRGAGAIVLLVIVLVFQLTVLPDTLGIKVLGRVANAVALASFLGTGVFALLGGRSWKAPKLYLIPVLLVILGYAINIARSLSPASIGAAGALLPWLAALAVPFMRSYDLERSWRLFYRFMLWGSAVSALEYMAASSHLLAPRAIETDRGTFLKGIFSIFYGLGDGSLHYRLYGLFAEPGTYAMYLLPVIAYAWMRGKRWHVALFLGCFYLTDSLGGVVGLLAMGLTYLFWRSSKRPAGLLIAAGIAVAILYPVSGPIRERYENKQDSRVVRETNFTMFRDNFASVVTANPLGLPLTGTSMTELENVTEKYLGSNFEIYTVFVKGGIIACFGYTLLLCWMIWRNVRYLLSGDRDPHRGVALICLPSLLLFIFQRETVLASALFAFLFAEPVMRAAAAPVPARRATPARRRRRPVEPKTPIALVDGS